ncbi:MAG: replication-associated recombination protein A [Pseudomonadota bacterium]|nr:replication-associated recombination protein A [Pseudomonadota bacterium]
MADLFTQQDVDGRPLAERLRPQTLSAYVGQPQILGPGQPLRQMVDGGTLHSMILWGPPGTGKTTLARLLAQQADCYWINLSAVLAGVKDIRQAVAEAKMRHIHGQRTVLFVDEVHRFNKAQQDAFLPHVEDGTLVFIGATTENPSFEVNSALLSRARVYVLTQLTEEDLGIVVDRAASLLKRQISSKAREFLTTLADGDARRLLNVLEIAAQMSSVNIDIDQVDRAAGNQTRRFDKGGDVFYEQISALHKSIRGSSPDAALYWFCRMLDGGADPRYVGRRLLRLASEDVGNADPRAVEITLAAVQSFERLGSPEGELALAQAVLYLASVPKSDAVYRAYSAAQQFVASQPSHEVPRHLTNAPTTLMRDLGYGDGYRHAHDEQTDAGAYAPGENYFPEQVIPQKFYRPQGAGLEAKIKARLERLAQLDQHAPSARGED